MAIDGIDARATADRTLRDAVAERNLIEAAPTDPLDRLTARHSPLDRLVADAGALGKFKTDLPEGLPAGTSSFTRRSVDSTDAVAARMGLPRERVWAGSVVPQTMLAAGPGASTVADAVQPGHGPATPQGTAAVQAPRPAVATDTDNRLAGGPFGNSSAVRA